MSFVEVDKRRASNASMVYTQTGASPQTKTASLPPVVVQQNAEPKKPAQKKKVWREMDADEREAVADVYAVAHCPGIQTPSYVAHWMIVAFLKTHSQSEVFAGIRSQCADQKLAFR
jgi:hypothetical protein